MEKSVKPAPKEIPLDLEPLLGNQIQNFRIKESPRRFYSAALPFQKNGLIEVDRNLPWYETAPFGEVILDFVGGKNRFQRITIIYARVVEAEKFDE